MLGKLFGRANIRAPWGRAPSIYRHVSRHIRRSGPGLKEGGQRLPDESRSAEASAVAGGQDGLLIHHLGVRENDGLVSDIYNALRQALRKPSHIAHARLYELITETGALQYIDGVLELVLEHRELEPEALLELARWWAREAPDRQAVKFALALLGLFNEEQDIALLLKLGRHDEFTLFAAVAISNSREESATDLLWELARNVDGWGRIHAVELLAEQPSPEVRDWLLREGYRNTVLYEYLAGLCARAGDLAGALRAGPDTALINSAVDLVDALLHGPGDELERYQDFAEVVDLLLEHLTHRLTDLKDLLCVHALHTELLNDEADWDQRAASGWTLTRRNHQLEVCEQILLSGQWKTLAAAALAAAEESGDERQLALAFAASEIVGVDLWETHYTRLAAAPFSSERWGLCLERATVARLRRLAFLAEKTLLEPSIPGADLPARHVPAGNAASGQSAEPLSGIEQVADNSGDSWGGGLLGPSAEVCLELFFSEIGSLPGVGVSSLLAALEFGSAGLRRRALLVFAEWTYENWPEACAPALAAQAQREEEPEIRAALQRLLNAQPLPSEFDESRL